MSTTLQKERDARLPHGFNSWLQFLRYCQNIPELNEMIQNQNRQDEKIKSIAVQLPGRERFECDIMTLKLRAFEEILPLLHTKEEAYHEYDGIHRMLWQLHPQDVEYLRATKVMKLLEAIID